MELCPVCEAPHPREALECLICGHIFHLAAVDASVVPLADLEPTRAADLKVGVEVTPGLEPTRFDAGPSMVAAVPEAPIEGLEPTLAAPQQVATEVIPDLEPTGLAEEEFPSIFAADVTCPNCGEVSQGEETFCAKCGMRLPRSVLAEPQAVAPEMTCTSCGGQSFAGGMCRRCGARQPSTG
jgi:ribosomal protein L32